ncbi:maestro heat-like repeat family member 5 [Erinaceus europaeus]|uniref:Maestro heat-like repeat family member 5 n=1 Tax=Erinaceus europaeus TaxID=9365 RepID=A0ABM3XSV4_ERIEU|nr:maestro heat-like repeat family member 5 [Erinaceus europaeus]
MVAAISNGVPSAYRSQMQKNLDKDTLDRVVIVEPSCDGPPWEPVMVRRIQAMSVEERTSVMKTVRSYIEVPRQVIMKEQVSDTSFQGLLTPLNLDPMEPLEKMLFFYIYGLLLRECAVIEVVSSHLVGLLQLSHQMSSQREGIALTIGIASISHLEKVWTVMEHVGHTCFLRWSFAPIEGQDPDIHWKWFGSTSLLCYGQIAIHTKEHILPWVDNIASRMVYYFSCSYCDDILKSSFLSATIMLLRALKREHSTWNYKFTQIPELVQCLLYIIEKEPNYLVSLFRQKIILAIVGLSNLRPQFKPLVKSKILETCLRSMYTLPPTEKLKSCLPPMESEPDISDVTVLYQKSMHALNLLLQNFISENESLDEICFLLQHTEPWLMSDSSHERKRVVQSIFLLLRHVVENLKLTKEAMPSELGHQIGLLMLLWWDQDKVIRSHSRQCVYLLLLLLTQQKDSVAEFMHLNKLKNYEAKTSREPEVKFDPVVKALNKNLTMAQHTQMLLTLLQGLCSHNHLRCELASQLLLTIFENNFIKSEQVAETIHGLFQELPCIMFKNIQKTMIKAVTVLGTQHTQETVAVMLSLGHPSERQLIPLWKALANNQQLARKVVILLYMKLKLRPSRDLITINTRAELFSLLALGTIYELLYIREYKATVRWAFAGILLGLLSQLHYLFELDMVEDLSDYQEDILETRFLSPCRTCLEALKGLFWTTNYWEVFAYLKLMQGWELFERMETYTEGVTLLARAMAHYDCEVKAVLGQAFISLKSPEERDNIIGILLITEFLHSQEITQYASRRTMGNFLNLGLTKSNQLVRALSLKGLSSVQMCPKKVALLRAQLTGMLESFLRPEPYDILGLMLLLGDILRSLGSQGIGPASLKMAQHLLHLFEDDRSDVRGGAIFLYGDVIHSGGKKFHQMLQCHAFQALVPLLFHMADSCPKVVMKTKFTFFRCAILLKWEFRKELFSRLAWGQGLGAENDIFIYTVESNFGNYHKFLMQAVRYLESHDPNLKFIAMKFIGGLLQDYFTDLCFYLKKNDMKFLGKYFESLKEDKDSRSRRFYWNFLEDFTELTHYVIMNS